MLLQYEEQSQSSTLDLSQMCDDYPDFITRLQNINLSQYDEFKYIPTYFSVDKIQHITQEHRIVLLKGTVVRSGLIRMVTKWIEYKCQQCEGLQKVYSDPSNFYYQEQLNKCQNIVLKPASYNPFRKAVIPKGKRPCGGIKFEQTQNNQMMDYQEIKMQDTYQTLKPGSISNSIQIMLKGKLVNSCKPGDDVVIGGEVIQRWKKNGNQPIIELWIDCKYLKTNIKRRVDYQIGEIDPSIIQRAKIVESFHSQIGNMFEVKLAILLCIIGGVSQEINGTFVRGDSHLLLVGEPGTGKSSLLREATQISDRALYLNGIGLSQAGLTVSYTKEGSDWVIDAGALVLADQGLCCIDEFNLINLQCQQCILEALEQQTISCSKGNLTTKLNARTTIIAACSPNGQTYDSKLTLLQQVTIESPLLSRFDLVFILKDYKDPEIDRELCEYYFQEKHPELTAQDIKQYIIYVKNQFKPVIPEEIQQALQNYYTIIRSQYNQVTVRKLQGMIRLSQAHARLCCRDQVEIFDIVSVIALSEYTQTTGKIQGFLEILKPNKQ
ncbi:hypothetical protein pb186bvf_006876 [Paramecium bursaria]